MAYSEEVKEYAKELFLKVGVNGDHKYTLQEIRDLICQEFDGVKKLKRQTIQQWSTTKDKTTNKSWVNLWDKGQRHGVKQAIEDAERKVKADEEIELQVDVITRQRANRAIRLGQLIDDKLNKNKPLENIDIKTLQASELIFNNLNLESTIDSDEPTGFDDLAKAINNSREKAKKADQEGIEEV